MATLRQILRGALANIPTLSQGQIVDVTDQMRLYHGTTAGNMAIANLADINGSPFYWLPTFVPPVLSNFSWVNQGGASASTTNAAGGLINMYTPPQAGENLPALLKSKTGQYTVEAFFIMNNPNYSYAGGGLIMRDSSSLKAIRFEVYQMSDASNYNAEWIGVTWLNSLTSYNADKSNFKIHTGIGLIALKIVVTTTTIYFYYATDCVSYQLVYSQTLAAWGSLNQIGFGCQPYNTSYPAGVSLVHWKES